MAYADDLAIYCENIDGEMKQIKRVIELIENWSKNNEIELNKKKGKTMIMPLIGRNTKEIKEEFKDKQINGIHYTEEYKHLGFIINNRGKIKPTIYSFL